VQVNRAYAQGEPYTAQPSQDVWSVAVIALELLSATPITHQVGDVPGDDHIFLATLFEKLAWWYHNLRAVGLQLAGVSADDGLTEELLHILQECFAADAQQRPTAQELLCSLQALQLHYERSTHAWQVCAADKSPCPVPG
jgi:hypothetical protein